MLDFLSDSELCKIAILFQSFPNFFYRQITRKQMWTVKQFNTLASGTLIDETRDNESAKRQNYDTFQFVAVDWIFILNKNIRRFLHF